MCHIYLYILPFLSLQFPHSRRIVHIRMIDVAENYTWPRSDAAVAAGEGEGREGEGVARESFISVRSLALFSRREKTRVGESSRRNARRYHVGKRALSLDGITHLVRARRGVRAIHVLRT